MKRGESKRLGRLGLMFAAHAMGTANISLVLAFAPLLQKELGLSAAAFGLAVSCYYAAQVAAALPAGWLVDRLGIRRALIGAHVVLAVGMSVIAFAAGSVTLSLGLAFCGLGYVLVNPATARGVLSWFDHRHRATAMGIKQTGVPIGAVAIALIAAGVQDWRAFAVALAAAMLLMTPAFLALSREKPRAARSTVLADLRQAVTHRRLAAVNVATGLYTSAFGAVLAYFVTFAYEVVHVSLGMASLYLGLLQGAAAVGRVGWGVAGDRLPGNGRITGLLACGLLGAAAIASLPFVTSSLGLTFAAILIGLTVGGFASLAQTLAVESVEPTLAGAAIGYNTLLVTTGLMLGPALFALVLMRGGYGAAWSGVALALVAGTGLFRASAALRAGPVHCPGPRVAPESRHE
ncbi:MAG TPA: MFS transporter [Usitatibacter sp.]|nr:MFS transporter [Usitatibacter sp.]